MEYSPTNIDIQGSSQLDQLHPYQWQSVSEASLYANNLPHQRQSAITQITKLCKDNGMSIATDAPSDYARSMAFLLNSGDFPFLNQYKQPLLQDMHEEVEYFIHGQDSRSTPILPYTNQPEGEIISDYEFLQTSSPVEFTKEITKGRMHEIPENITKIIDWIAFHPESFPPQQVAMFWRKINNTVRNSEPFRNGQIDQSRFQKDFSYALQMYRELESNKETVIQTAERLAKETRKEGAGFIHAKFPRDIRNSPDFHTQGYFAFTHEYSLSSESSFSNNKFAFSPRSKKGKMDLQENLKRGELPDQIDTRTGLVISSYKSYRSLVTISELNTDKEQATVTEKKLFGKPRKIPVGVPEGFKIMGKELNGNWFLVTYSINLPEAYDQDGRYGSLATLHVAVNKEIMAQIDTARLEDCRFFDAYFEALYPDLFGEDESTQFKPIPITEIAIKDLRIDPTGEITDIQKYPPAS